MMIAIKDLEKMPKCCTKCRLAVFPVGGGGIDWNKPFCAYDGNYLDTEAMIIKRPDFCPLIEVKDNEKVES